MHWTIEYNNDIGPYHEEDEWTVTNGERRFRCSMEHDAKWLRDHLNNGEHLINHNREFEFALRNVIDTARIALGQVK